MRAPCFLFIMFFLIIIFVYQTIAYLYPLTLGWLLHLVGITTNVFEWGLISSACAVMFSCTAGPYFLLIMMRRGTIIEGVISRFMGGPQQRGAFYEFLSTLIQLGRYLFYKNDLSLVIYVSYTFLILILFLDLFARRLDTNVIVRKIAKRCIYGALIMLYERKMFDMNKHLLPLPGALIPLVPALVAGYILVFCSDDLPQHGLVPNWFDWRCTAAAPPPLEGRAE